MNSFDIIAILIGLLALYAAIDAAYNTKRLQSELTDLRIDVINLKSELRSMQPKTEEKYEK